MRLEERRLSDIFGIFEPNIDIWLPRDTRRSRVELGLGRGGLELKLHEEEHKYIEAKLKFNEAKPS